MHEDKRLHKPSQPMADKLFTASTALSVPGWWGFWNQKPWPNSI